MKIVSVLAVVIAIGSVSSASAQVSVSFGFGFGGCQPRPTYCAPRPVVIQQPVWCAQPTPVQTVVYQSAPVQTVVVPQAPVVYAAPVVYQAPCYVAPQPVSCSIVPYVNLTFGRVSCGFGYNNSYHRRDAYPYASYGGHWSSGRCR